MMRDPDLNVVRVRAFGTYDFRVRDPKLFLREVAGSDARFTLDDFAYVMRSRIVSVFSDALVGSRIPVLDMASRYSELGEALLPLVNPVLTEKYGVELTSFVVENVSVPPEVEDAIDKRSGISAVGDLNDYVKYQMGQGMAKGTAGVAAVGAEMAVGMAVAQQMTGATAAPAARLDVLGPEEVAKMLGVLVGDVVSSLEAGDLKGKKIGSQWRISRAAVEQFMKPS
jgi:excisionase family DNA binding protein